MILYENDKPHYYDKNGKEITDGCTIRYADGHTEKVYRTTDDQLGTDATNPSWIKSGRAIEAANGKPVLVILNIYACRCPLDRGTVSAMMTATTWMDAGSALAHGFIDAVADPQSCPANSARAHVINRKDAEAKVQVWLDRHNPQTPRPIPGMRNCETPVIVQSVPETEHAQAEAEVPPVEPETQEPGVPADQLHKRLNLIKPNDR